MSTIYEYNTTPSLWENYASAYPERKLKVKQGFIMFEGEPLASFDTTEAAEAVLIGVGYKKGTDGQFSL